MKILNLIRYKNLSFIVLIQCLVYFSVITPILQKYGLQPLLPNFHFWLLVFAAVLIAAGGYVINDYFDLKIDRINRPEKMIVGEQISKKTTMSLYIGLTFIGVMLGVIVAILLKNSTLGFIFVITAGMLWFYSASYKRQFLIGNLLVALMAALLLIIVLIAESSMQIAFYSGNLLRQTPVLQELYHWVCGFAMFAFIFTLIREIIKDMEDINGDREMECRTLPIVWGETNAKIIVTILLSITLIVLYFIVNKFSYPINSSISLKYFIFGIALPSFLAIFFLWYKKNENCYKNSGNLIKFIMLIGILYALIFNYLISKFYNLALFGVFQIV
ncbi:MAG: geranylgeranylglycerol-phosphate geranylgeranyltransferase [Prevotellaceae bacterium]|jgi:4-hydroxybenzoate polyprenyltransferase|nr:geranylgeranylglycerol-phosphate geranylgeranyltransferase [Prevotellaceae bacterium]